MNKDETKMIDAMCKVLNFNCKIECDKCQANEFCSTYFECKALYNANCRIIADDEIVIKKSEYEKLTKTYAAINSEAYYCGLSVGREEVAKEILQEAYMYFNADNVLGLPNYLKNKRAARVVKGIAKSRGIELEKDNG